MPPCYVPVVTRLSIITGLEIGELFDLEKDPREHRNLWDDPDFAELRFQLMQRSFDALAYAVDPGTQQILYY